MCIIKIEGGPKGHLKVFWQQTTAPTMQLGQKEANRKRNYDFFPPVFFDIRLLL